MVLNCSRCSLFFLYFLMLSCTADSEYKRIDLSEKSTEFENLLIPRQIWEKIELRYRKQQGEYEHVESKYFPLEVRFSSLDMGVLKEPVIIVKNSFEGGVLDLAELMGSRDGIFEVDFLSVGNDKFESVEVYFISDASMKTSGSRVYGLGCGYYLLFSNADIMNLRNIRVATQGGLHAHVLSGIFLFLAQKGSNFYLTALRVFDSSVDISCRR